MIRAVPMRPEHPVGAFHPRTSVGPLVEPSETHHGPPALQETMEYRHERTHLRPEYLLFVSSAVWVELIAR